MATIAEWIEGARLRTLPAAVAPVLVGTGAAAALDSASMPRAGLALGVALSFQVGVNYANDYSDGVRGTDEHRVGPMRLTGSHAAPPKQVKAAAFGSFVLGAVFGLALVALSGQLWLLGVGALCILAAWGYTGGRHPYGYVGLGDLGVFVFFGLVAVLGTTYTQAGRVSWAAVGGAVSIGLYACAILMANNVRDIATDELSGKRTLAVRLGEKQSRWAYVVQMLVPFVIAGLLFWPNLIMATALVCLMIPTIMLCRAMLRGVEGHRLVAVLRGTGFIELAYSILVMIALLFFREI